MRAENRVHFFSILLKRACKAPYRPAGAFERLSNINIDRPL